MSFKSCRETRRGIYCKKSSNASNKYKKLVFNDLYDEYSSPDQISNIITKLYSNNIKELHINRISGMDVEINLAIQRNNSLNSLIISNTEIDYSDLLLIRNLLRRKQLHTLKLQNVGLENEQVILISDVLTESGLVELDISNNKDISDIGGEAILKAIKTNVSLNLNKIKEINVSGTEISRKIIAEMEQYIRVIPAFRWKHMKELLQKEEEYGYKI